jgi:hypothetical protein
MHRWPSTMARSRSRRSVQFMVLPFDEESSPARFYHVRTMFKRPSAHGTEVAFRLPNPGL